MHGAEAEFWDAHNKAQNYLDNREKDDLSTLEKSWRVIKYSYLRT